MVRHLTRRSFAGLSLGGLSSMAVPHPVLAAQCVASTMPNLLVVNCASRKNFQLFRRNSDDVGLAGIICMKDAASVRGTFSAGSLILFPWLKPAAQKKPNLNFPSYLPAANSTSSLIPAKPIPNALLPQDEYICRYILQAPWHNFIGFMVDKPSTASSQPNWSTRIPKLADGAPVEINWGSANLNSPWFGGARSIPNSDVCHGTAWRKLITNALNQASTSAC